MLEVNTLIKVLTVVALSIIITFYSVMGTYNLMSHYQERSLTITQLYNTLQLCRQQLSAAKLSAQAEKLTVE